MPNQWPRGSALTISGPEEAEFFSTRTQEEIHQAYTGELHPIDTDEHPPEIPIGPHIDITEDSQRIVSPPPIGDCVVCMEALDTDSKAACDKLNMCGHAFHAICIDMGLNSMADRSNYCPECRARICDKRQTGPSLEREETE